MQDRDLRMYAFKNNALYEAIDSAWTAPQYSTKDASSKLKTLRDFTNDQSEAQLCFWLSQDAYDVPLDSVAFVIASAVTIEDLARSIRLSKIVRHAADYSGYVGKHEMNSWCLEISGERGKTKETLVWKGVRPERYRGQKSHTARRLYHYFPISTLAREGDAE